MRTQSTFDERYGAERGSCVTEGAPTATIRKPIERGLLVARRTTRIATRTLSQAVTRRRGPDEVRAIWVQGFKSLETPCRLEIRPLTLLAGPNSSGKSSLFQPLLLMKQTVESAYDPGPLLLDGPNVKVASARQLFTHRAGHEDVDQSFCAGFDLSNDRSLSVTFELPPTRRGVKLKSMTITEPAVGFENLVLSTPLSSESSHIVNRLPKSTFTLTEGKPRKSKWVVEPRRCFLDLQEEISEGDISFRFNSPVLQATQVVEKQLTNTIHLPGLRGNPERSYPRTAVGRSYPGQFQDYVASIIHGWQVRRSPSLAAVATGLEELGLTWKVASREVDDTRVELQVGRLPHAQRGGARDLVNIADVGLGTSQILPVLVALEAAQRGELVLLEQPEIHLHPRAQSALARALARAARRGVRVIAETHSSLLLRGVQTLVAKNELAAADVSLHWFTRDPITGMSSVTSAELDDFGRFGDWPEDFDDVALNSEAAYLDAVEEKASAR